ncbi:MAG: hypothetical protein EX266_10540 [Rhodobacteraceae bacterium]|nr:MAG: hypothetical protein EX266_10540 [Paracoccaceae bacterium]
MAKKTGPLRTLRDAADAHVIPVAEANGFDFDPSSSGKADWNENGYQWRLVAKPRPGIVLRLQISTGVSRDPALHATWAAFDTGETSLDLADAARLLNARIADRGDDFTKAWIMASRAAEPISLSPWRGWAGSFSLIRWIDTLPAGTLLRLLAGIVVYPFLLLWLTLTLPITILAIVMDNRWLTSNSAKSGVRQDKIARRFTKRLSRTLPRRLPIIVEKAADAS